MTGAVSDQELGSSACHPDAGARWPRIPAAGRLLEGAVTAVLLVAACAVLAYAVWGLDRGFEITDEAYYLLLAIHPAATRLYISAQQWVTGPIWQLTGSLASFRAAGLLLLAGSSAVLAAGVLAARSQGEGETTPRPLRIAVFSCTVICGLLYVITINLSPSYNLLASAAGYLALGLVLLAGGKASGGVRTALFLAAGVAIAVATVCKASSGVAIFVLVVFGLAWTDRTARGPVSASITMIIGGAVAFAVLLFSQTSPGDAVQAFRGGMDLFRMVQPESIGARLARYAIEFGRYAAAAVQSSGLLVAAFLLYLLRRNAFTTGLVILALAATVAVTRYFEYGAPQFVEYMQRALVFLGLALALAWRRLGVRDKWLVALLALLPYSVAMGTGNAMFGQVVVSLAPWGALMALAAYADAGPAGGSDRVLSRAILVAFVVMTSAQILVCTIKPYYGLNESMRRQNYRVAIGPLGQVKVDWGTQQFMKQIDAAVAQCRIAPGAPVLGLYHIPGLALALDAVPVVTPWLNNVSQADVVLARDGGFFAGKGLVAIKINADGSFPDIPAALTGFPSGFRYCGKAVFPHANQNVEIWQAAGPR